MNVKKPLLSGMEKDKVYNTTFAEDVVTVTFFTVAGIAASFLYLKLKYGEVTPAEGIAGLGYLKYPLIGQEP